MMAEDQGSEGAKKGHPNQGVILRRGVGRPSKFSSEMVEKGYDYLATCVDSVDYKGKYLIRKVNMPLYEGLALFLGINKDTVVEWSKNHDEFSVLTDDLKAMQVVALVGGGLSGDYNPAIVKAMLSKHGYREVSEQEQTITSTVKFSGIEVNPVAKPESE